MYAAGRRCEVPKRTRMHSEVAGEENLCKKKKKMRDDDDDGMYCFYRREELEAARTKLSTAREWLEDTDMYSCCAHLLRTASAARAARRILVVNPCMLAAASARVRRLTMARRQCQLMVARMRARETISPEERYAAADEFVAAREVATRVELLRCLGLFGKPDASDRELCAWQRLLVPLCGPAAGALSESQQQVYDYRHWSMLVLVRGDNKSSVYVDDDDDDDDDDGGNRIYALHYDSMLPTNTQAAINALCVLSEAGLFGSNNFRMFEMTAWPQQTDSVSCGARALLAAALHVDFSPVSPSCPSPTTTGAALALARRPDDDNDDIDTRRVPLQPVFFVDNGGGGGETMLDLRELHNGMRDTVVGGALSEDWQECVPSELWTELEVTAIDGGCHEKCMAFLTDSRQYLLKRLAVAVDDSSTRARK